MVSSGELLFGACTCTLYTLELKKNIMKQAACALFANYYVMLFCPCFELSLL